MLVDPLGKVFDQKLIYVYTKLCNVGNTRDKNKNRIAGCGKWHMNATENIWKNGVDEKIGSKSTFTFQSEEETVSQWIMHEFALVGVSLERLNSNDNFVPGGMPPKSNKEGLLQKLQWRKTCILKKLKDCCYGI